MEKDGLIGGGGELFRGESGSLLPWIDGALPPAMLCVASSGWKVQLVKSREGLLIRAGASVRPVRVEVVDMILHMWARARDYYNLSPFLEWH